jgi:hypothetical protein
MMMDAVLDHLDLRGVKNVELHANPEAAEFYSQFGFRRVEEVSFYTNDTPHAGHALKTGDPLAAGLSWLPPKDIDTIASVESGMLGYRRQECARALTIDPPHFALAVREGEGIRGLLLARTGLDLNSVGMWVLADPDAETAEAMMRTVFSSMPNKPFHACIPTASSVSRDVMGKCGFSLLKDDIVRMSRSSGAVRPFPEEVLSVPDFEVI